MKKLLLSVLLLSSLSAFSQSHQEIDSISYKMCDRLKTNSGIANDTLRIQQAYEQILFPFLAQVAPDKAEAVGQTTFFRFQRNCPEFREILNRLNPPQDDVSWSEVEPESEITSREIKEFKKTGDFSYFEVDGKLTQVLLQDGFWTDTFTDNTFSRLSQEWITDKKFELTFIESNNVSRANFSFKGDKLIYKLLDKKDDHYVLSVNIPGQDNYEIFKLYYQ